MKKKLPADLVRALFLTLGVTVCATLHSQGQIVPGQGILFNRYDFTKIPTLQQLAAINPDGTGEHQVTVNLPELGFPTWSKDGLLLAVSSQCASTPLAFSRNVFTIDVRTSQVRQITQFSDKAALGGGAMISSITFPWYKAISPDKTRLAVSALEYSNVTVTGDNEDPADPNRIYSSFKATPVLQIYGMDGMPGALVTMCGMGTDTIHAGDGVDWAPNQDLLVFPKDEQMRVVDNVGQVFMVPITPLFLIPPVNDPFASGKATQLTFPQATVMETWTGPIDTWETDFQPAFSPNGKAVAYVRAQFTWKGGAFITFSQVHSLRLVQVDGSNDHEITSFAPGKCVTHLCWAPDGSRLAFDIGDQAYTSAGMPTTLADTKTCSIWTVKVDGTGLAALRTASAAWPAWYPGTALTPIDQPHLEIGLVQQPGARKVVLAWPVGAANLQLQSAPNLSAAAVWNAEPTQPTIGAGRATVTLSSPSGIQFYRLLQH